MGGDVSGSFEFQEKSARVGFVQHEMLALNGQRSSLYASRK